MRRFQSGILLAFIGLLAGCEGALNWTPSPSGSGASSASAQMSVEPVPATYTVKTGDTLYSIAWRYGLDYHDLANWNNIGSDYLIKPGQTLRLSAPAGVAPETAVNNPTSAGSAAATASALDYSAPTGRITWKWPVAGRVTKLFHADSPLAKGIDISGARGTDIRAAAAGKVVYAGSGIIGYGKLIIIKNSEQFLSAYADNDELLVREGDKVQAGDRIATMGLDRDGHPLLHFEIRRQGKPVNPLNYLPSRR